MLNTMSNIYTKTVITIHHQPAIVKLCCVILALLAPLAQYIHFLIFLLFVDAATSIYYQYKLSLNKLYDSEINVTLKIRLLAFFNTIDSGRLRRTFEKLVAYVTGIIVCFLFDKIALQIKPLEHGALTYFSVANIAVVLIMSVEVTSILANLSKITRNPIYLKIIKIFNSKINDKLNEM